MDASLDPTKKNESTPNTTQQGTHRYSCCCGTRIHLIKLNSIMSGIDEDFNCPPNLSGPDCDIPFEQCPDGIRRCFNNSRCVKNSKRDMVTAQYGYSCDCSYAGKMRYVCILPSSYKS